MRNPAIDENAGPPGSCEPQPGPRPTPTGSQRNVFICHASRDEEYVTLLKHYAAPVINTQLADLRLWEDSSLLAGNPWSERIQEEIARSIAAVVVVSDNLLNATYAMKHEMPRFLARAEAGDFEILCLYARDCLVDEYVFQVQVNGALRPVLLTKYQGLNSPRSPVDALFHRRARENAMLTAASRSTTFNVHWEGEQALAVGDQVEIIESRPISRIKHHLFVRKATP